MSDDGGEVHHGRPIGPNGYPLITFGPNVNCTLDLCPVEWSVLEYRPSVPASAVFLAIFSLSLAVHIFQGVYRRTWGFMGCMIGGCLLEIVGYIGRVMIYNNPYSFDGFLLQIIFITIAPVFFCAGVYVLLAQVSNFIDPSLSRIRPSLYYWTFIPCDIVSLVLQAVGGALSTTAGSLDGVSQGANISLAGLVFQVFALLVFSILFADYLVRCWRRPHTRAKIDGTRNMKWFLGFMFLGTFFILLRCVYRIVELHDGYFSHWFRDEKLFIALESAVMSAAVVSLNIGHPGLVFGHKGSSMKSLNADPGQTTSDETPMENVSKNKSNEHAQEK